jgi:hypothetical protein
VKTLPFDLEFLCLDDAIHFPNPMESRTVIARNGSKFCGAADRNGSMTAASAAVPLAESGSVRLARI